MTGKHILEEARESGLSLREFLGFDEEKLLIVYEGLDPETRFLEIGLDLFNALFSFPARAENADRHTILREFAEDYPEWVGIQEVPPLEGEERRLRVYYPPNFRVYGHLSKEKGVWYYEPE